MACYRDSFIRSVVLWNYLHFYQRRLGFDIVLTFSGQSTHICALKRKVEVAKVHIFVQLGI
jgi:hypothetical protein